MHCPSPSESRTHALPIHAPARSTRIIDRSPLAGRGCGPPTYAADESCPDVCDKHYPNTPDGRKPTLPFPNPTSADMHEFSVEDTVAVPADIAAGAYVLGWRWDC